MLFLQGKQQTYMPYFCKVNNELTHIPWNEYKDKKMQYWIWKQKIHESAWEWLNKPMW